MHYLIEVKMKRRFKLMSIFLVIFFLVCFNTVYADDLMSIYKASIANFPSVESFKFRKQSLEYDIKALNHEKIFNLDGLSNLSRLHTIELGNYTSGNLDLVNTFDLFNKKGIDTELNKNGIQMNYLLTNVEKKNIFTKVTEAYFNLYKNQKLLKIHEESLEWINKNVSLVTTGVEKGVFPATDLSRWTIEKLNQLNFIQNDKLEMSKSEETLKILSGLEILHVDEIAEMDSIGLNEGEFLKNTPEVHVFDLEQQQRRLEIKRENRSRYPDLQLGNSLILNHEPYSTGNQDVVLGNLSFKLFDGGRKYRIQSSLIMIKSIESDKNTAEKLLIEYFRNKMHEINAQKEMVKNLSTSKHISADNLEKLLIGYQKRFIDFTTFLNSFKEDIVIKENYINLFATFNQNYQYLYHLSKGDIY